MPPLTAGTELAGRFRLQRLLGRGGSAEVWAAGDSATGTDVALRILVTPDEATAASLAVGLQADADRQGRLAHPGIVRPLAVVLDGCLACVAFELVDGGDLGVLRGAAYQPIIAAVRDVAETLQYVHAQGLTHGDLKAGNVLRDRRGSWRLADFRSAALPDANTPVSLSGASPQQLAGAPPTTADDIYSLGALLYDLLAGQPPLHPDITAERIRSEVPARLGVDGQGQALPLSLTQLVGALLEKTPGRRPGSIGAVRALLAEIAGEAERPPAPTAPVATGTTPPSRRSTRATAAARSPLLVAAVFTALLVGVVATVVWLPRVVSERGPLVRPAPAAPAATGAPAVTSAVKAPEAPDARALAETALADRMRAEDAAKAAAAERWAGADWLEAQRLAGLGDAQFRDRDFAAAAASFSQAAGRFRRMAEGAPAALAAALAAGRDAFGRGDQPAAVAAFEHALLIRPGDAAATKGLARSRQLDQVLAAMAEAAARESAGDPAAARTSYERVLKLDAEWAPARAALARLAAGRAASDFERAMAQGLAAVAAGRTQEARSALNRALALRPGDAGARSALEQLAGDERRGQLAALQADAARLEGLERWADAAGQYRAMLNLDATLAAAQAGLTASEARADLHRRLEQQLANAGRFNDDAVAAGARTVVSEAEAIANRGPLLAGQVTRLEALLAAAAVPVPVQFESDSLTSVAIYKVGNLGAFASRTVELKPGTYVIVGTRDGYRDVRRTVRIDASGSREPISVRCEEPI